MTDPKLAELIEAAKAMQRAEDDCEQCSDMSYMPQAERELQRARRRLRNAENNVAARDFTPDAIEQAAAVDGWKWAPVEPTEAMLDASLAWCHASGVRDHHRWMYGQMLAAAPAQGDV